VLLIISLDYADKKGRKQVYAILNIKGSAQHDLRGGQLAARAFSSGDSEMV
jgi:hypothetical protein